jgi:hypothetical protein
MPRSIYLILLIASLFLFAFTCKKPEVDKTCHKGRLEVKGNCMNYTIKVLEGDIKPQLIQASWKDEHTGKTHENVFRLENVCEFPSTIKEGDEFYFRIENNPSENCVTCQAFYPTPAKGLSIKVSSEPCSNKQD